MAKQSVPRVLFKKDWDFKPSRQATVGYKAGWQGPVSQACADAAVKAGVAERFPRPKAV